MVVVLVAVVVVVIYTITYLYCIDFNTKEFVREICVEPEAISGRDVFSFGLLGQHARSQDPACQRLQCSVEFTKL